MAQHIGPREQQLRALREAGLKRAPKKVHGLAALNAAVIAKIEAKPVVLPTGDSLRRELAPAEPRQQRQKTPPAPAKKERAMAKKAATKKAAAKGKPKAKKVAKAKTGAKKKGVPAIDVANFICRDGGASMEELVKEFGIDAHPMRAKIFYVRHTLGYAVEIKEGRYIGTAPKREIAAE